MRVLWTVNLIPAEMARELGLRSEVLGGWVESMAAQLRKEDTIELAIACKTDRTDLHFCKIIDRVTYYSLSYTPKTQSNALRDECRRIVGEFCPDVIHVEGTEFLHAKAMLEVGKQFGIPVVASMQGILNGQYAYQCGQLPIDDMMFSRSLTNIFAAWILHLRKTRWYRPRMKPERELIRSADYILGRTTWDRAHTYAINPHAQYFSCSRVLRAPFYETKWSVDNMERHSIYVGNGYYALKGLHFVLQAVAELRREYPDIKLYVAGYQPYRDGDRRSFLKKGYAAYLKKLVEDLKLEDCVIFTGPLNAEQVANRLATVNVYVLASAVENSPNTLGEAMLVGTPCVAAYVGGVPDMVTDGKDALIFRNDDPALMAWKIKQVFDSDELCQRLSENGQNRASVTHDPERNAQALLEAYRSILHQEA